jgi:hypothetical protein
MQQQTIEPPKTDNEELNKYLANLETRVAAIADKAEKKRKELEDELTKCKIKCDAATLIISNTSMAVELYLEYDRRLNHINHDADISAQEKAEALEEAKKNYDSQATRILSRSFTKTPPNSQLVGPIFFSIAKLVHDSGFESHGLDTIAKNQTSNILDERLKNMNLQTQTDQDDKNNNNNDSFGWNTKLGDLPLRSLPSLAEKVKANAAFAIWQNFGFDPSGTQNGKKFLTIPVKNAAGRPGRPTNYFFRCLHEFLPKEWMSVANMNSIFSFISINYNEQTNNHLPLKLIYNTFIRATLEEAAKPKSDHHNLSFSNNLGNYFQKLGAIVLNADDEEKTPHVGGFKTLHDIIGNADYLDSDNKNFWIEEWHHSSFNLVIKAITPTLMGLQILCTRNLLLPDRITPFPVELFDQLLVSKLKILCECVHSSQSAGDQLSFRANHSNIPDTSFGSPSANAIDHPKKNDISSFKEVLKPWAQSYLKAKNVDHVAYTIVTSNAAAVNVVTTTIYYQLNKSGEAVDSVIRPRPIAEGTSSTQSGSSSTSKQQNQGNIGTPYNSANQSSSSTSTSITSPNGKSNNNNNSNQPYSLPPNAKPIYSSQTM